MSDVAATDLSDAPPGSGGLRERRLTVSVCELQLLLRQRIRSLGQIGGRQHRTDTTHTRTEAAGGGSERKRFIEPPPRASARCVAMRCECAELASSASLHSACAVLAADVSSLAMMTTRTAGRSGQNLSGAESREGRVSGRRAWRREVDAVDVPLRSRGAVPEASELGGVGEEPQRNASRSSA